MLDDAIRYLVCEEAKWEEIIVAIYAWLTKVTKAEVPEKDSTK